MRRTISIVLAFILIFVIAAIQKLNTTVEASPDIYQGDLILTGNNVTIIEGRFDINGSIIVTENATLVLNNAVVNFTQATDRQFNMTFRNPVDGNPRLLAYNSTITSGFALLIYLYDNSTAIINNSTVSRFVWADNYSTLTVLNSSYIGNPRGFGFSNITVYNSTMGEWHNYDSSQVEVYDSKIGTILIGSTSVNSTISDLKAGNFSFWNFLMNCSVTVLPWGYCPNVTLTNTTVSGLRFIFYGSSNATIMDSTISEATSTDSSVIRLIRSSVSYASPQSSAPLWAYDSSINLLYALGSSTSWLLNTTYNTLNIQHSARVYVGWYLDVHVIDSIGQNVPSANVTATYPNATVAQSKLTDANGLARLTLMEKMINATGEYLIGNYNVNATYETHSNSTEVSITGNKEITLPLDFVIPEFPSFLILPLFIVATLLAVIVYRRKRII